MAKSNSIDHGFHETLHMYPNLNAIPLSDQQLNKIKEIKDYFVAEINERDLVNILLLFTILTSH